MNAKDILEIIQSNNNSNLNINDESLKKILKQNAFSKNIKNRRQ